MKKLLALLLALVMVMGLASCAKKEQQNSENQPSGSESTENQNQAEKLDINVAVLSGPTGMGAAKLLKDADDKTTANNYNFTVASSPDEVTASIISGEYQIACIPTNLAAVLYRKTSGGIKTAAINTLGVLYILTNGVEVSSVEDLRGKTVYATNQGSAPEYILNYVLTENGLSIGTDVTVEFSDADTVSAGLVSGDIQIAMLPEPKVTATIVSSQGKVSTALNMTEEWEKLGSDTTVTQGCIVVNSQFASEHPGAVNAFLDEYRASVEYTKSDVEAAAALCETYQIIPKAAIAQKAYPNCNITLIEGEEMRTKLKAFLTVLYEADAASVGGSLPDEDFFYER